MRQFPRAQSSTDVYHITARGAGRQIIFEEDEDRSRFLHKLLCACRDKEVSVLAFCLMDNHFHLLLKGKLGQISSVMQKSNTSLAGWHNGQYGHVGHVLQGRFHSSPVEGDAYFLDVVRYIHLNPRELGVDFRDYAWSSYREYLGESGICDKDYVMRVFGSTENFVVLHESAASDALEVVESKPLAPRISDAKAREVSIEVYGANFAEAIRGMNKRSRDEALRKLQRMGISIRQLERLTGIGRGIIQPAVKG